MSRKFIGYIERSVDEFGLYDRPEQELTLGDLIGETLRLRELHGALFFQVVTDYPMEAVVFATEPITQDEAEDWYDVWADDAEQYMYVQIQSLFKGEQGPTHKKGVAEFLESDEDEYAMETDDAYILVRYDRILAISKTDAFDSFSIATDKLYRWHFNPCAASERAQKKESPNQQTI